MRYQESENYKSAKLLRNVLYIIGITDIICGLSWLLVTLFGRFINHGIFDFVIRFSLFSQVKFCLLYFCTMHRLKVIPKHVSAYHIFECVTYFQRVPIGTYAKMCPQEHVT
jgi:hypothetical protein